MLLLSLIGVPVLAALLYISWFLWTYRKDYFGKENRDRYFAQLYKDFPIFHNRKTKPMKEKLFEILQTMKSRIPEMQEKNSIRILEIGAGSGANFEFYPVNTSLIALEPNKYFQQYLDKTLKKFPNVHLERFVDNGAEDMKDIPDHSVDVVVSTLVLCSIPLQVQQQVFKEIRRVLVPGGKFLFMEHVVDEKISLLKIMQSLVGTLGIWEFLYDGCRPDVDVETELRESGFTSVEFSRFHLDLKSGVPRALWCVYMIVPHLYGIATTAEN